MGGTEGVAELALVRAGGGPLTGSELGSTIIKEINFQHFLIDISHFLTVFTNQE